MVEFSNDFSSHRLWEMREGVAPPWSPPELKWEAVTLTYTNEKGLPVERPVWVRPIANGKVPLGAWTFDVKVRGFQENGMSFLGELRRGDVRGSAQEVRAPAQSPRQGMGACPFCLAVPTNGIAQTALLYRGAHATILANMPLPRTVGCDACRAARKFPAVGYMVPVEMGSDGRVDQTAVVTALWAELDRLEGKREGL